MKIANQQSAEEIELIPFVQFAGKVKKVLAKDKIESDQEISKFQAANVKKREARKKKR